MAVLLVLTADPMPDADKQPVQELVKSREEGATNTDSVRLKVQELEKQQEAAKSNLRTAESQLAGVAATLFAAQAEFNRLSQEKGASQEAIRTASAKLQQLSGQLSALEEERAKKSSDLVELSERSSSKKAELAAAERDLAEIRAKLREYSSLGKDLINYLVDVEIDEKPVASGNDSQLDAEGKTIKPGRGTLHDEPSKCSVRVSVAKSQKAKTLRAAGVTGLEILLTDGRVLDIRPGLLDVNQTKIAIHREDLCDLNRKSLSNMTQVRLRISFLDAEAKSVSADYVMTYRRALWQFDFGVGTYFAGGDLAQLRSRSIFSVYPALRVGGRLNIPLGDENRDFYLQANGLLGGGFVASLDDSYVPVEGEMPKPKLERLSIFIGATLEIGRYLEVGWAYDPVNQAHLVVIAPGRILTASIFTY